LLLFVFILSLYATCPDTYKNAAYPKNFCARAWASTLSYPRGIYVASNGDLLVVEAGRNQITALYDSNGDGVSDLNERVVLAKAPEINHGIDWFGGYLYASSTTTVYRWKYNAGDRKDLGRPEIVITNLPCCGHSTRTLRFNSNGELLVQSGSGSNVDHDSSHSQIRKFTIRAAALNWKDGVLLYDGLRNEIGFRYDSMGRLWGIENGVDNLKRNDLGGDIHNENPSEEVNLFTNPGFYGYPFCWSEGRLASQYAKGPGTQRYHPNFNNYTDAWCAQNSIKPAFNLPAHSAPIDIVFIPSSWPVGYKGNALISLHGSWNRNPPIGYSVVHLKMDPNTHLPTSVENFLYNNGTGAVWPQGVRPAGMGWVKCAFGDCLYIAIDSTGQIMEMSYRP